MKEPHPWDNFLNARYEAMLWLRDKQKLSNAEIAKTLSMDEEQVRCIFHSMHLKNLMG